MTILKIKWSLNHTAIYSGIELISAVYAEDYETVSHHANLELEKLFSSDNTLKGRFEADLWCGCKSGNIEEAFYVPDNRIESCSKHHWRCGDCKGIVQIG